ncbi:uncharacterized protein [Primulina huaijiensis]|uniref:uncharacterized protein n=1 Tax=Primulina huaijiensis TaxID=1492673 RepID=UPI003CC70DCC
MTSPLPSVGQAFAIISQEESTRNVLSTGFAPPEISSSAFFSTQDRKKTNIKCDHCNMPGHIKAYCYKLVGYPPHHRLFKGSNTKNQRNQRDWNDNKGDRGRTLSKANNVAAHHEAEVDEIEKKHSSDAQFFSPEQYAAILRMLKKDHINQESSVPVANMAGPVGWDNIGDW